VFESNLGSLGPFWCGEFLTLSNLDPVGDPGFGGWTYERW
jgi:hypothetical protein